MSESHWMETVGLNDVLDFIGRDEIQAIEGRIADAVHERFHVDVRTVFARRRLLRDLSEREAVVAECAKAREAYDEPRRLRLINELAVSAKDSSDDMDPAQWTLPENGHSPRDVQFLCLEFMAKMVGAQDQAIEDALRPVARRGDGDDDAPPADHAQINQG